VVVQSDRFFQINPPPAIDDGRVLLFLLFASSFSCSIVSVHRACAARCPTASVFCFEIYVRLTWRVKGVKDLASEAYHNECFQRVSIPIGMDLDGRVWWDFCLLSSGKKIFLAFGSFSLSGTLTFLFKVATERVHDIHFMIL
jgi:hypothetical protein